MLNNTKSTILADLEQNLQRASPRTQSLKLRMLAIVLAATCATQLAIAFVMTICGIWASERQIERRVLEMMQSRAEIVAGLLWRFEYENLDKIISDILLENSIVAVKIFDDAGKVISTHGDTQENPVAPPILVRLPLHFKNGILETNAGVFEATIRHIPFFRKYSSELFDASLLALFSAVAISIAIWMAMTKLVNKPLDRLLHAIERSHQFGTRVDVEWEGNDEISTVIRAFNAMQLDNEDAQREIVVANAKLRRLIEQDVLTGPNRRAAQRAIGAHRGSGPLAIHFMDLDEFKAVNDSYGHAAGDALLITLGKTLADASTGGVQFYRMGGDEFIGLQTNVKSDADALGFANDVHAKLCRPYNLGRNVYHLKISMGTFFSNHGFEDGDELLGLADAALFEAKRLGRNCTVLLTEDMRQRSEARVELEKDLATALKAGKLEAHFQPQLDLRSGRVIGFEALSRWTHPVRGPISPSEFIPLIETMGLSIEHGKAMMRTACAAAAQIQSEYGPGYCVAINVNAEQLLNPAFISLMTAEVLKHNLARDAIEVEITESELVQNFEQANNVIEELHEAGISVAIDDFGTGYSSLSYLSRLKVNRIKIDRSFVTQLTQNRKARPLVELIAGVAHALSLSVVAEGIESEAEELMLRGCGINFVQGFRYARPMPIGALQGFMRQGANNRRIRGSNA